MHYLVILSLVSVASASLTWYSESEYDRGYLREYKKMIKSLIKGPMNLVDAKMILKRSEHRTAGELYGKYRQSYPECSQIGLKHMKTVKVLQDEESNYVMLKEKDGKFYVEKSTRSESSFDSELEFFSHLNKANKYFPVLTCYMRTPGREERLSVVTEFIRGRESEILAARATPEQLKSMVKQLFEAVVELHRMGYIHADIKPGNVLVTDDFQVKLIDFGMATRIGHAKKYRGSPYTRAPELHNMCPGPVDVAIDWWAFGATVAIWYYYHFNHAAHKHANLQNAVLTPQVAIKYFEMLSSYDFTPMKWKGGYFTAGIFPPAFAEDEKLQSFLALFLTIDPLLRTFDSERLQNIVRSHEYFN